MKTTSFNLRVQGNKESNLNKLKASLFLYFLNNSIFIMDRIIKGQTFKEYTCLLLWKQSQQITAISAGNHQTITWEI